MRHGIVEGEPGIFPDPIARLFVAIARFLRRRGRAHEEPPTEAPGGEASSEESSEDSGSGHENRPSA